MESRRVNKPVLSKETLRSKGRPTLGLIIESVTDNRASSLWAGAIQAARQWDANLLCFPILLRQQANRALYDLVDASGVDGRIIHQWWADREEFEKVYSHWRPTPVVNAMRSYEGYPGVIVDDYQGMRDLVRHLIEVHGYRRIALVRGPQGVETAEARFRAYQDALKEQGLPFEPALVAPGDYGHDAGVQAVRTWLDQSKLRAGVDLQAIVASNDDMAQGVLDELLQRGMQAPYDIAVTGFDNNPWAEITVPPLTTVTVPYHEIGRRAVEVLVAHLQGKPAPAQSLVPTRLVVRQSCGCFSPAVTQASAQVVGEPPASWEAALTERRDQIRAEMAQAVGDRATDWPWAEELIASFVKGMKTKSDLFLQQLDRVLRQAAASGQDVLAWQGAISVLRRHTGPFLKGQASLQAQDLWEQARVMIGEAARQAQVRAQLQAAQQAQALHALDQALATSPDTTQLVDTLYERLPALGISSCYLSLYEAHDRPTEYARLVLAYNEQGRIALDPDGRRFPARQLAPEGLLPQDKPFSLIVEPLSFHERHLGFVLFEAGLQNKSVYETLRGQISSALESARLVQQEQERSAALARQKYILDTFMDTVPDRIYFKDLEGRITQANRAHATRLGLSDPAQEIGKTDFDFFARQEAQLKYEQEQHIIRTGQPLVDIEEQHVSSDGRVDWTLTTKMPLRDEQGRIVGTFGISRDITDLKRAHQVQERRARELQAAAAISRVATSILDLDELIQQVVNLVREQFDLYYVGLFLVDRAGEWAVLRAGAGPAGQQMLEQGHKLEISEASTIGWCITHRQARLASDVDAEAVHFSHPLLPATRSELALPLISRGQVIGALTVQSDQASAFDQDDVTVLQTMADQVASAIENARLFAERKQAEEALQRERNLLRALIDNIPDRIYAKDTQSRFIVANLASARRMGRSSPDELIGKSDFDLVPRELAEQFYADEQAIIQTGEPLINREEPMEKGPDGQVTRWNLATKVPLRDSQGNIIGIVGLGREITDLKRAQAERERLLAEVQRRALQFQAAAQVSRAASSILEPNELMRQAVNLIRDRFDLYYVGLFLLDQDKRYAVLQAGTGEAGQQMLAQGHKLEVGGASMIGWCTANRQARLASDVDAEAVHFSHPLLPATRSELALPLISRGQVIGALTVQSDQASAFDQDDITVLQTMADQIANAIENARLYQALAQEQYLMSVLMENAPDYIYFKDAHSRFIRASKALARSFGLSDAAQLVGKTDFDFFTEAHARSAYEDEQRIIQTGQPLVNVEEKETRPDRPDAWVLTTKMPLRDQAGNIIGTFGISKDITDLKLAETQAREALRELERLYRITSREGWQALRETTQLVPGYLFDRATLQPRPDLWMPQIEQAIEQNTFVPPTGEQAVAVAPLSVRGEVIGAVGVYDDPERPLSAEELDLVQQITEQGALALESARLFEQTQASLAEARALYHFSEVVSRETDLQIVYDAVSRLLMEELGYTSAWLTILDEDGRMLKGVAGAGARMTEDMIHMTLPISEGHLPVVIAARERKTIVVNDPLSDKRLADLPATVQADLGKAIATPILIGDDLQGVILATRSQAGADISPRDERLLQAVASQVAVAIQRAQLFEQTRAALAEVEATHRRYLRQEWETFLAALDKPVGFVDSPAGVRPASEIWLPEMEQAIEQGEPVVASAQRAALAVPLKLRGEPIGVLEFYEEGQPHTWNDDERALVQALADQAALALENARLFEETQARAQREQLINAITARIRASMDMETVLKTTAQELSRTLNLARAHIRLGAGDGDQKHN